MNVHPIDGRSRARAGVAWILATLCLAGPGTAQVSVCDLTDSAGVARLLGANIARPRPDSVYGVRVCNWVGPANRGLSVNWATAVPSDTQFVALRATMGQQPGTKLVTQPGLGDDAFWALTPTWATLVVQARARSAIVYLTYQWTRGDPAGENHRPAMVDLAKRALPLLDEQQ